MSTTAILAAAGRGSRMGGGVPKALRVLGGRPLFLHSLQTLATVSAVGGIVVVAPEEAIGEFAEALRALPLVEKRVRLVRGGPERQDSVAAGLVAAEPGTELILVHDAARPFVTRGAVEACIASAKVHGAAILAVPLRDTVKWVEGEVIRQTLDRDHLWCAQTPQVVRRDWLETAYRRAREVGIHATDEASLLETAGFPVRIVLGEETNRKLTTPEDWLWAEWYLVRRNAGLRT